MITGRELRSTLKADGVLTLSLEEVHISDPAAGEVILRVEAAPINPSDLLIITGPASPDSAVSVGTAEHPVMTLQVPPQIMPAMQGRIGQSLCAGNEGAGTVIATGAGAEALTGKLVATFAGDLYTQYRKVKAQDIVVLPEGASAAEGAAIFVNPLTALGIAETALTEGHKAIVHTAAASTVGQMLQKICLTDGIPLVNIVRSEQQADILRGIGARHVLNSTHPDFPAQLIDAIMETGATIAFDPIGGGTLGSDIISAMEQAAIRRSTDYSRYGSSAFKQLYLYGGLDLSPVILNRLSFGTAWSVGSWFLTQFLEKAGPQGAKRLQQRVLDELTTTFATHYARTISLVEAIDPDIMRDYNRKATGEKFLIDPSRG